MFAKRASEEGFSLGTLLGGTGGKDVLRRLHDDLLGCLSNTDCAWLRTPLAASKANSTSIAREVSPSSAFAAERMSRAAGRCAVGSRLTASAAAASALFRNGMNVLSLCSSASDEGGTGDGFESSMSATSVADPPAASVKAHKSGIVNFRPPLIA